MKYIKQLAMWMLPFAMVACSDDNEYNGGAATVGFAEAEMTIQENVAQLNVPIVVEGEHNGLVKVNVAVKDATGTNVVVDTNVLLTSGEIYLPADVSTVYAEHTGSASVPITIAANEAGDGYDCTLNYQGIEAPFRMLYSPTAVEVVALETIATLNFGDPIGMADVQFMGYDGQYVYSQNIPGVWNDTFDTITFELGMAGGLFNGSEFLGYTWFAWTNCVMTKN